MFANFCGQYYVLIIIFFNLKWFTCDAGKFLYAIHQVCYNCKYMCSELKILKVGYFS